MKTSKLLKIVKRFIGSNKKKQCKNRQHLLVLLKKLKQKEKGLQKKLKTEPNNKEIKEDLAVIYRQRQKGIEAIKSLK